MTRAGAPGGGPAYRRDPVGGPTIRTDIVEVYVFRRVSLVSGGLELLQLRRTQAPLAGTWHPVMGHAERGERAARTAVRELREETGLSAGSSAMLGLWALERVRPFYLAALDCIVMGPKFAVEADAGWSPRLNDEHDEARWISSPLHGGVPAAEFFLWPGQRDSVSELSAVIADPRSAVSAHLAIDPSSVEAG